MLRPLLAAILIGFAAMLATSAPAMAESFVSGGVERGYEIFRSNSAAGPRPTVIMLHGGASTAAEMRRYTGFDILAEAAGIVAVYPRASPTTGTIRATACSSSISPIT